MPATQKSRMLAIGTVLGEDVLLIKTFTMTEHLGRLFQMEAELRSDNREIKFEDIVGTAATVRLELPDGKGTRYFNGHISRFVQIEHRGSYAVYEATLVPWVWFLTRTADCRIFQNKKVPDIIEDVFKGHGFSDYKLKLTGTYRDWEYCVQYRETDFNFISRLMEQEGIYYYFEHADGVHKLVLADSPSAHEAFEGYDTMVYRPPTTEREEHAETITEWVIEKEIQPGQYVLNDFNFTTPKTSLLANANISRQHQAADFEVYDYPGEYEQRPRARATPNCGFRSCRSSSKHCGRAPPSAASAPDASSLSRETRARIRTEITSLPAPLITSRPASTRPAGGRRRNSTNAISLPFPSIKNVRTGPNASRPSHSFRGRKPPLWSGRKATRSIRKITRASKCSSTGIVTGNSTKTVRAGFACPNRGPARVGDRWPPLESARK